MVIEGIDRSVENVSRSRVVLAPEPRTLDEIQNNVRPLKYEELKPNNFSVENGTINDEMHAKGTPVMDEVHENPVGTMVNDNYNSTQVEDNEKSIRGSQATGVTRVNKQRKPEPSGPRVRRLRPKSTTWRITGMNQGLQQSARPKRA